MIPRIVHQSWKTAEVPREYSTYVHSWRTLHPDWEFRLWTDEQNEQLVHSAYPELLEVYRGYPLAIQRADMARVLYLHRFGGLYVDLDFECLRPFDALLQQERVFLGREKGGLGAHRRQRDYACNALMASPPGHPFWETVLQQMVASARPRRWTEPRVLYVLDTTGPGVLDRAAEGFDVLVYPSELFYASPVNLNDPELRRRIARRHDSYAVHHCANSWFSPAMQLLMTSNRILRRPFRRSQE